MTEKKMTTLEALSWARTLIDDPGGCVHDKATVLDFIDNAMQASCTCAVDEDVCPVHLKRATEVEIVVWADVYGGHEAWLMDVVAEAIDAHGRLDNHDDVRNWEVRSSPGNGRPDIGEKLREVQAMARRHRVAHPDVEGNDQADGMMIAIGYLESAFGIGE